MFDKDPKDMTASELLRKAGNGYEGSSGTVMTNLIDLMGLSRKIRHSECCYDLADKIDAELAKAREESLRQGAMVWAKANGWPDFREDEGFGEWLERCAIQRPFDESGEPWLIGDRVIAGYHGETTVTGYSFNGLEMFLRLRKHGIDNAAAYSSQYCQRPAPEALGADGLPVKEGETVWLAQTGDGLTVDGIVLDAAPPYPEPMARVSKGGRAAIVVRAADLTHTPPDTLERLRDDMYRTAEEWREADSVSIPDMNHWADRLAALIERKEGAE